MIDDKVKAWLDQNSKDIVSRLEKSKVFLALLMKGTSDSPLCALQIGQAILLGKPIAVLAVGGFPIPPTLRKIALAIHECGKEDVADGMRLLIKTINEKKTEEPKTFAEVVRDDVYREDSKNGEAQSPKTETL